MAMIGTTAPLLLLAALVVHHHAALAALHLAVLVVALEVLQEAPHAAALPRAHLAVLVAGPVVLLVEAPAVALPAVVLVAALPVAVPVVVLVEARLAGVPKAVALLAEDRKVAHPSERAHLDDYKRIQMPSPASTIPIISSNLRAFCSSLVSNGVPEIIRATSTYQPPSIHIAMKATKARSPQVKSG